MNAFERRDLLLSDREIDKINKSRIAIFGLGGVGGYTLEALVRMGISDFVLVDGDRFEDSNLNRQLLSSINNIGRLKTDVAEEKILSINPNSKIVKYPLFLDDSTKDLIDYNVTYIVDCIDDANAKVILAEIAKSRDIPIIAMMGAGNRIHADFIVSDIKETSQDPLSKKMRRLYKDRGIDKVKVVYTKDPALRTNSTTVGSISYVVGYAGLKVAEAVISDIINKA